MATNTTSETEVKQKKLTKVAEHIVEIVSDPGEGAQKAGQSFGTLCAKMGNGIWTVEIIPAEIQPPPRTVHGASGIRIRFGSRPITNAGDEADLVVSFNEQVIQNRIISKSLRKGATILLENKWRTDLDPDIAKNYAEVYQKLVDDGYKIYEISMDQECLKYVDNPRRGKNMFVLGMLSQIYTRDMEKARNTIRYTFRKKPQAVVDSNLKLLQAGYDWAENNLDFQYEVPSYEIKEAQIVVDGNTSIGLGAMASGMDICAMYPITPATSVSHYLAEAFHYVGGTVHQAEDEIAACGFAIGASYAGKCAFTVTSGPGLALKMELIGLASMAEIPLVVVDVQRGGPSTGLPTKVEQADLLMAIFGTHGDAPKIVMSTSSIEDCFYSMITARKLSEEFRMPVMVLTDANLATGQQPFPRPKFQKEWLAPEVDQSPVEKGKRPYEWDPKTGLSERFIPGRPGGMHTLTGLSHDEKSHVAYHIEVHQHATHMRSLKLAAFQKTLKTPKVMGGEEGDILIVGWGSTKGAIEEAVERLQKDGYRVSSLHIKFLQPMASGIKEILQKFKKVITVEINYSDTYEDELITPDNRRYANLAWLLRARYLIDVDCWSKVFTRPIKPGEVEEMIRKRLGEMSAQPH